MKKLFQIFSVLLVAFLSSCVAQNSKYIIIDEEYGLTLYDYTHILRISPKTLIDVDDFYGIYNDKNGYGRSIVMNLDKVRNFKTYAIGEKFDEKVNIGGYIFEIESTMKKLPLVYTESSILTLEEAYYFNNEVGNHIKEIHDQFCQKYYYFD